MDNQENHSNEQYQSTNNNDYQETQPSNNAEGGDTTKILPIIIIIVAVIAVGLYLLISKTQTHKQEPEIMQQRNVEESTMQKAQDAAIESAQDNTTPLDEAVQNVQDPVADQLGKQGTSDNLQDIEADLNASDIGDVNLNDLGF